MVQGGGKVHREVMPLLGDRGVGASLSPRASRRAGPPSSHTSPASASLTARWRSS
jgi:hypothetical protein